MSRMYALRHCETLYNAKRIISGQSDIHICSSFVDLHCYQIINKCAVITSPLVRCIETSKILSSKIEVDQVIIDSRLKERHMGIFQDKERKECQLRYPMFFNKEGKFNREMSPPGGESFSSFYNRVNEFWGDIRNNSYDSVIIVSHNQTLKLLQEIISCNFTVTNFKNGVLVELYVGN